MNVQPISRGGLTARLAASESDIIQAQKLRYACFVSGKDRSGDGLDRDRFDADAQHGLVFRDKTLVACFRLRLWQGAAAEQSYTAQFYDLSALKAYASPMMELGRFCVGPDTQPADVLRLAWALITAMVDADKVGLIFGCTSFMGASAERHAASLSLLSPRIGPPELRPAIRSKACVGLCDLVVPLNHAKALAGLPPLLRTYLGMGGWVSDHAVIDDELDTLHVFTAVEVARIPAERAKALRALLRGKDGVL